MNKAIYAGTFDPITLGHLDIIKRASSIFDELIIGILDNSKKIPLFSKEIRESMIIEELKNNNITNVKVVYFQGLLIDMCREYNAKTIVRGLRAVTDFEYELQLAQVNKGQAPEIDTIFFTTNLQYTYVSSSIAKEIASYNGNLDNIVTRNVEILLKQKLINNYTE